MMSRKTTVLTLVAVATLYASSAALAVTRFAHKQSAAGTGATCGQNANIADATFGPCTTVQAAYDNAKTAGGTARVILMGNGVFKENVVLDYTGGASEIRRTGDGSPGIATNGAGDAITIAVGSNRVLLTDIGVLANGGVNGLQVNSVGTVELVNVEVRGFSGVGINFAPSGNASSTLLINKSDIGFMSGNCIFNSPSNQDRTSVVIKDSLIHNCGLQGVRTDAGLVSSGQFVRTHIVDSVISNVNRAAVSADGTGAGTARVTVERSDLLSAVFGANSNGAHGQVVLNRATIMSTGTALQSKNGGALVSYGNNVIDFNASNGDSPTVSPLK